MSARQFLQTLFTPRPHRNIRDLTTIFKFHYSIKGLYPIGVGLNLARYFILYPWKRLRRRGAEFTEGNFFLSKKE